MSVLSKIEGPGAPLPGEGWCCSYCAAPLTPHGAGLYCPEEERWFATERGIHRLLTAERRWELRAFLELEHLARRDQGFQAEASLPEVGADHPHARLWRRRARRFREGVKAASRLLGAGPWRVLEVGAGCCWASVRLASAGHDVTAVDLSLDANDGLMAAETLLPAGVRLWRAEADMEALPLEPRQFDLVLAVDALHHAQRLSSALIELRRVTRRHGALLVLDSPVHSRREDGEREVARRMQRLKRRYGIAVPRESQPGYLVSTELQETLEQAGWRMETARNVDRWRERLGELGFLVGWRRRARHPVLLARRDG